MTESLSSHDADVWEDITEDFKQCCSTLEMGELIHLPSFGLFDAMSAFEMMDPKMDSGMTKQFKPGPPKTLAFLEASGELKLKELQPDYLLSVMDSTLCCFASWVEGTSLAQSVLANLYLHNPYIIEDTVLKAFCIGILKLTSVAKDMIVMAHVYEDDHFQHLTYGYKLAEDVSNVRCLGMLKEAEDELSKSYRNEKSRNHHSNPESGSASDNIVYLSHLLCRVQFLRSLLSFIFIIKRESVGNLNASDLQKIVVKLNKNLQQMSELEKPVDNPLDHEMFDTEVTSRLLPPSFPRAACLMNFKSFISWSEKLIKQVNRVINHTSHGLINVLDLIDELVCNDTSVITRTLILYGYIPPNTQTYMNKIRLSDLFLEELKSFNCPPTVCQSLKTQLLSSNDVKLMMTSIQASCSYVIEGLMITVCNTRARQRERLVEVLSDLSLLQQDSDRTDSVIDSLLTDKVGEKVMSQLAAGIGTWVLYLATKYMIQYINLGLELELYDVREYCYVYWYLAEFLYSWHASAMSRAESCLNETNNLDAKSVARSGKKQKANRRLVKPVHPHQSDIYMSRVRQTLCAGYYRVMLALKQSRIIPAEGLYQFDNEQVRYKHRFSAFIPIVTPQFVPYSSFCEINKWNETDPQIVTDNINIAVRSFQHVVKMIETIPTKLSSRNEQELKKITMICKNNIIATKILETNLKTQQKRAIKFEFTNHKLYPIIKFS